ncbi:SCP2 sterol-binding domain-containing protein [Dermatobacter hominis]|uniref:SCP2 sterol-binding domain-containing protein n=1 Tax=Dermatobacter hominis TaxID=2884263 RepID=UPI001D12F953|nr:SCP2 sterol-binding domain-containing protein [Dermatobacter hominis]UDY37926.1 SCP2 sterol-binding domain-containing protein [Dermatobacter hominis]
MVAYLSDEWLERAGASLAASDELAQRTADLDLAIAYEVAGAPAGKVGYTIRFDHGTTSVTPGAVEAPVSFQLDYDTAAAIAKGDLSAQAAFMQGRLKLVGDVNVLIRDGAVLDGVADALGELRADTEF